MTLEFTVIGSDEPLELDDYRSYVAGYTGRDAAAVQHHIDELAAIGVAPPPEVPMFYPVDPATVSQSPAFDDSENLTSGEVEPLYVRAGGRWYFGVASDHTDRDIERDDIGDSKRACPKPVGTALLPIDLGAADLDAFTARSWVDGRLYQEGSLSALRQPADVIGRLLAKGEVAESDDIVVLGGTVPLLDGAFTSGTTWTIEIEGSDGTRLTHEYTMNGKEQR